jgi:DNA-binding ferritin-like protein
MQTKAAVLDERLASEKHNDVATSSLIEVRIDQTERRAWFLRETAEGQEG